MKKPLGILILTALLAGCGQSQQGANMRWQSDLRKKHENNTCKIHPNKIMTFIIPMGGTRYNIEISDTQRPPRFEPFRVEFDTSMPWAPPMGPGLPEEAAKEEPKTEQAIVPSPPPGPPPPKFVHPIKERSEKAVKDPSQKALREESLKTISCVD